jgi:hypothetical protein
MAKDGEIVRRGRGRYILPGSPEPVSKVSKNPKRQQAFDGAPLNDTLDTLEEGAY